MILIRDIGELLTLKGAQKKRARHSQLKDLSLIKNAAVLVNNTGLIEYCGPFNQLQKSYYPKIKKEFFLEKRHVLPAFIESHTHLVFSGNRAHELDLRNQGLTYQDITKKGGGIFSTVKHTRQATQKQLIELAHHRLTRFLKQGVGTVEIKTGYGLDFKSEEKLLKVINHLQKLGPQIIVPTFLGAHANPHKNQSPQKYLNELTKWLPRFKKQAQRLDIFIEKGFFETEFSKEYLEQAKKWGWDITIHADQLSRSGASLLGLQMGAKSIDHVIHISNNDIQKLSKTNTTAVLLPSADLYLKCPYPPARKLIDQGVTVALSTDFNPGTSPTQDISFVGSLARIKMKMSLAEVIVAYTLGGAYALGLEDQIGSIQTGKLAHLCALDQDWDQLFWGIGEHKIFGTFIRDRFY